MMVFMSTVDFPDINGNVYKFKNQNAKSHQPLVTTTSTVCTISKYSTLH